MARYFPSGGNLPAADILDGLSHTIFLIETIDEAASRWTVGKEATLVGLPQKSSPTGTTPQAPYIYFAPSGLTAPGARLGRQPGPGCERSSLTTSVRTGADAGKYEDPGFSQDCRAPMARRRCIRPS